MIRELTEVAVDMTKQAEFEKVLDRARENVEEKILDILLPASDAFYSNKYEDDNSLDLAEKPQGNRTREKLREQLRKGELDDRMIEFETQDRSNATIDFVGGQGMEEMGVNFQNMFGNLFPTKTVSRKMQVSEARNILLRDEQENLVDMEQITRLALEKHNRRELYFSTKLTKSPDANREAEALMFRAKGFKEICFP